MKLCSYKECSIIINEKTGRWISMKYPNDLDHKKTIRINSVDELDKYFPEKIVRYIRLNYDMLNQEHIQNEVENGKVLIILTSNVCNLSCEYCYMSSGNKGELISTQMIIRIIDSLIEYRGNDQFKVLFQGGEPMLSFSEIREAVEYYKKLGSNLNFSIQSNGTIMTKSMIKFFKDNNISLGISHDGSSNKENIGRFNDNCVNKKIEGTKENLEKSNIPFGILSVVSNNNVDNLYSFYLEESSNNRGVSFNPLYPIGKGSVLSDLVVNLNKYTELNKSIVNNTINKNFQMNKKPFEICYEGNLRVLRDRVFYRNFHSSVCTKSPCGAGTETITVDFNGYIYPCTYYYSLFDNSNKIGTIDNLKTAFINGQNCKAKERRCENISICSDCAFAVFCGGGGCTGAINNSSEVLAESPYCEYYKEIIPYMIVKSMESLNTLVLKNF
ncbi:radical SAM protein [Fusibacter sp. JL298sf-3]